MYQTRPRTVTDLKHKHTEQEVDFMSLETTRKHIISIELSLLWAANRFLANEKFLHLLLNPRAHYSQASASCPYPEPYESSTQPVILF